MFNARDLLGQLMRADLTSSTSDRVGHALGAQGLSQPGNPIGDLLRSFQGGGQSPGFSGLAEAAQAVTGAPAGPWKPNRMAIWPAARFGRNEGTTKGDSRRTPAVRMVSAASVIAGTPPTPVPIAVAVRVRSSALSGCQPA